MAELYFEGSCNEGRQAHRRIDAGQLLNQKPAGAGARFASLGCTRAIIETSRFFNLDRRPLGDNGYAMFFVHDIGPEFNEKKHDAVDPGELALFGLVGVLFAAQDEECVVEQHTHWIGSYDHVLWCGISGTGR